MTDKSTAVDEAIAAEVVASQVPAEQPASKDEDLAFEVFASRCPTVEFKPEIA